VATISQGERGIRFTFEVDPPLKNLGFELGRFATEISDWSDLLRTFSPLFQRHMAEAFETEGAATGGRWADVSDNPQGHGYKSRKKASGHGTKIGVYSGALRSAMTGGGGFSVDISKTHGSYGMSTSSKALPYGHYFKEKRPVVRLSKRQIGEYAELTKQWTFAEARKAGIGNASLPTAISLGGGVATSSVLARVS
jgi:hypothetical protein